MQSNLQQGDLARECTSFAREQRTTTMSNGSCTNARFSTPLPLGPEWATDYLAFLTSGAAYAVVGARLWTEQAMERSAIAAGTTVREAR